MANLTKQIHDVESGEIIVVELTDEEQAQVVAERESYTAQKLQQRAEAEEKKQTALEKLAALGLEFDDLKALGLG